jgi:hypothetical protein
MLKPCQDAYCTTFSSLLSMMDYHEKQAAESQWKRMPVNSLSIAPLDESSPLYGNPADFAPEVNWDAIEDTAQNLGLAVKVDGAYYPLRDTACKSLLDRAKINGTALPKLSREELANTLNSCLRLFKSEALLLIRDEKAAAVHSGDTQDYAILPINDLMKQLKAKLDERFPESQFESGYADHSLTSVSFLLPKQRDDLLQSYEKTLTAQGKTALAAKLVPGIRFSTSDTGVASAKVSGLLLGLQTPIQIGDMIAVEHRWQKKTTDFADAMDKLFARFGDYIGKLEHLTTVYLDFPVNAMTAVCKKLSLPKKAAMEAIQMFEMSYGGGYASAHDVFMALQEIAFILKTEHVPQAKLLSVDELLARSLTLKWSEFDYAKAVSW